MTTGTIQRAAEPSGAVKREDDAFLREQLITCIGNKRSLLGAIGAAVAAVRTELGIDRIRCVDIFSGSGAVARFLKRYSSELHINDLETYSRIGNECYLTNECDLDADLIRDAIGRINEHASNRPRRGFISELYAPRDDERIAPGERVFYTRRNAEFIDTARQLIAREPRHLQPFLLGPLLARASVHANTAGVFKGFYKNSATGIGQFGGNGRDALSRITRDIVLPVPIFSRFTCDVHVHQQDANILARQLADEDLDLIYIDPPYNQHPYGSNYFMLNLIADYQRPSRISRVSGIPCDWNRSDYNKRGRSAPAFLDLVHSLRARYLLVSFNCEGFISPNEMEDLLGSVGTVRTMRNDYNTFRGSRNLGQRSIHVTEFLYLVKCSN